MIAQFVKLDIEHRGFAEGCLDATYLRDLTADMEMDEAETVAHTFLVEELKGIEELGTGETKLAGIATALFPFTAAAAGKFDANAQLRLDIEFLCHTGDDLKLVEFLYYDEDALAHLLCKQSQLDIALVLVAVADDERVALTLNGDDGMELGLGTGLKTKVKLATMGDDLLYYGLHLIHLDGIDDKVFSLVMILLGSLLKTAAGLLNTIIEYIGEAKEHGWSDISQGQLVHHLSEIYLSLILAWGDIHVTVLIYSKVRGAPSADVIELLRIFDSPFLHFI